VYSVSCDTHFVHKAWHDASPTIKKIKFPMLADPTGALSRAFGVYIESDGLAYRGSFLVDPEGKIKLAEIQDNGIGRNADELVRKVQAAQFIAAHPARSAPPSGLPAPPRSSPDSSWSERSSEAAPGPRPRHVEVVAASCRWLIVMETWLLEVSSPSREDPGRGGRSRGYSRLRFAAR